MVEERNVLWGGYRSSVLSAIKLREKEVGKITDAIVKKENKENKN